MEDAFWVDGVLGICWGPCSVEAVLVSLVGELLGKKTISSTCVGSCSEALADLGVRGGLCDANLKDFLEGLVEDFGVAGFDCEGEYEDLDLRDLNLRTSGRSVPPVDVSNRFLLWPSPVWGI